MAEIDLGKVRGDDGSGGGGLIMEDKIFVYERRGYNGQGIWYRKIADNLVEIGIDYLQTQLSLAVNASAIIFTLPEGYRPSATIYFGIPLTYNTHHMYEITPAGDVKLHNASSAAITRTTSQMMTTRYIFTTD